MSSCRSAGAVNALQAQLPSACGFLNIPLEVRDIIYGMLLTTPYCTTFDATGYHPGPELHLHAAILLVNRQVSAEALRVLYQRNHFIVFKAHRFGLDLSNVPEFKLLSESKITSPVLMIKVAVADSSRFELVDPLTLLTTLDGLQSIIKAIWRFEENERPNDHDFTYCPSDLSLTLNYNPKAVLRYYLMSDLVLKPWTRIHDLKELVLTGDIEEPKRENLQKSNFEGPFPGQVATQLAEYHSQAEREFERKDYNAARWWCNLSDEYWDYIHFLGPYHPGGRKMFWQRGDELWDVLMKSSPMYYEMRLKLVRACLRQLKYEAAIKNVTEAISGRDMDFEGYPGLSPDMETKLLLGACLAHTALEDITRDLTITENNELMRLKSSWRCGRRKPLSLTKQTGPQWQVGECQRSFWEWLELPEKWELAWAI